MLVTASPQTKMCSIRSKVEIYLKFGHLTDAFTSSERLKKGRLTTDRGRGVVKTRTSTLTAKDIHPKCLSSSDRREVCFFLLHWCINCAQEKPSVCIPLGWTIFMAEKGSFLYRYSHIGLPWIWLGWLYRMRAGIEAYLTILEQIHEDLCSDYFGQTGATNSTNSTCRFGYFVFKQPRRMDYSTEGGYTDSCSANMSNGRGPFRYVDLH